MSAPLDLQGLRAVAEKATQSLAWCSRMTGSSSFTFGGCGPRTESVRTTKEDAAFIAAANPSVVLRLLERLEVAEAVCEAVEGRHSLAVGDRVGAALSAWRSVKGE